MYKIGDFSQLAQISVRMLRHYDKLGLLKPGHVDQWTGYRYYTLDQLARLHRIVAFRDLGLSLKEVGDVLDDAHADVRLYEVLKMKRQTIQQRLTAEQALLDRVASRIRQIERVREAVPYDVALKTLPAIYVAAIREVVPHVSQMAVVRCKVFMNLYDALAKAGFTPGIEMAIYHLQSYAEKNIDMSLAVEVSEGCRISAAKGFPRIRTYNLVGEPLAASIVYTGDMWKIPDVIVNLYRWLGMNGYTSVGPYRELHHFGRELDHYSKRPPGDATIEILVPIKKI